MGVQPAQKKERNQSLIHDYQSGMSYVELVTKYQISSQRVFQIIKANKNK